MCSGALESVFTRTIVEVFPTLFTKLIGLTLELAQTSSVPSSLAQCSQRKVPAGTVIGSVPTLCHFSIFSSIFSLVFWLGFMGYSTGCVEWGMTKIILCVSQGSSVISILA